MTLATYLLTALALLALLGDVVSTHMALSSGAHESNPVMAWLMRKVGKWPALIGSHLIGAAVVIACHHWAVSAVFVAAFGWVSLHNWRVFNRAKAP